ncbi:SEC-C metal-binding domain-containing protein [Mesorhizobium muleiense]|uniref:SEC-C metal-binding domain-containing protein n=1 Tax=Mesorhizobium muleiense TaxID=1004279 RepID=UPI001F212A4F|nr:SEC-C metal-binding domain-containing protein [Mesorhizobium muleiense]MCF6101284.1 SEC-C domain-containing protein [Mesorhizobium muleiense]
MGIDFEDELLAAEQSPNDIEDRFRRAGLGYIDDVLEALEWTSHLEYFGEEDLQSPLPEQTWLDELKSLTAPVTNPWRHVGRNDPCPCGSGKKAKKCCLVN